MPRRIPNVQTSPSDPGQAVPDATDDQELVLADGGTYVVSGLTVTSAGGRSFTVAAGTYRIGTVGYELAAPATVTLAAGSATGDRRDIIVVTKTGTAEVIEGTPCTTVDWTETSTGEPPVKPEIPATTCEVEEIYVPGNATTLTSSNLWDKRILEAVPVLAANNGADFATKAATRENLGLGSAATHDATAFDAAGDAAAAQTAAETYAAEQATAAKTAAEAAATALVTTERERAEAAEATNATAISTETTRAEAAEGLLAPKANPTFTDTVTASGATAVLVPTPAATDNSNKAASTAWVQTLMASYLKSIPASGDTTGATDTAAIEAAWAALRVPALAAGETYYVNGQLASPNLLGLVGIGRPTVKIANGANLGVPLFTTANAKATTPLTTPFPGIFATLIVTMNCTNQTYAGQAWLTGGAYYLNGPDAFFVVNKDWTMSNILVKNQPRNAFVTADASLGANTVGKYSGVGHVSAKAIGGNRLVSCYAIGYGSANRTKITGCTATAGGTTIKVPSGHTIKPGMTVIGKGVFPYTLVVSTSATGSSTIAHLSQKLARNPGTKFAFTYGWSRHWATSVSSGSTDGWDLNGEAHHLNGAFQDRFEGAGGWQIENPYLWNGSYGQAQYLWGQHGKLVGGTYANAGWTSTLSVVIGTLATAWGHGTSHASVALKAAVGAHLAQFTPVLIPTPSGTPLVTCLSQAATPTTTTIHIYQVRVPSGTTIAATTQVRMPFVFRQTMGLGIEGMPICYGTEKAGNDYLYAQEISAKTTTQAFVSSLGATRVENDGAVNGLSSVGLSVVGFGTGTHPWTIRRPDVLETGPILTTYTTAGHVTITWLDGTPGSPSVALGGGQLSGRTTAAVIAKVPHTALVEGSGVTITAAGTGKAEVTATAATVHAFTLAADVTVPTGAATVVLTTPTLTVGTWRISVVLQFESPTVTKPFGVWAKAQSGTATATYKGRFSGQAYSPKVASAPHQVCQIAFEFVATVTVAGTVQFAAHVNTNAAKCKAKTPSTTFSGATGGVAQLVAA